ncbi:MAG: glycosyltransferase family 1 protein [Chloroflexi bacterium]|nr:glycosyltransferase family 1 protein [Chloroflexota bacterium]
MMIRYRRALDTWMSEELVGDAVDALLELADQIGAPDVIVTDPFLTAAALTAEKLGAKLAVCGWVAMRDLRDDLLFPVQKILGDESRQRLDALCARFGLAGRYFSQGPTPSILSPSLHVSYFNAEWYQADLPDMMPQTLFVGGKPIGSPTPPAWLTEIPEDAPLAVITLGTTFTGDLGFFAWAAQAAAQAGLVPIVAIGWNPMEKEDKAKLIKALPRGTRLVNFVPFATVLPRTRIMCHHGGMGTTHAALIHGVPQIVVPHAADQRGQARRAAQAKVGLHLTAHDVRQGALGQAFNALMEDERVQAAARATADDLAQLGGPPRAAEALAAL